MKQTRNMTAAEIETELKRLDGEGFISEHGVGINGAGPRVMSLRIALAAKRMLGREAL